MHTHNTDARTHARTHARTRTNTHAVRTACVRACTQAHTRTDAHLDKAYFGRAVGAAHVEDLHQLALAHEVNVLGRHARFGDLRVSGWNGA
jgi:hypothetical protein